MTAKKYNLNIAEFDNLVETYIQSYGDKYSSLKVERRQTDYITIEDYGMCPICQADREKYMKDWLRVIKTVIHKSAEDIRQVIY